MPDQKELSPPQGKYISANGLEIFYQEWGSGRPLILLHGATDTHKYWVPVLDSFGDQYRVIIPDSRGHGRTINPEPFLSYSLLADDLAGLIRGLELESPVIFGYSDGGQAALDFGIRYPDLAGGLVLGGIWFRFSRPYQESLKRVGFTAPGVIDFGVFEEQAPRDWEDHIKKVHHDPRLDYPRILISHLAEMWWTPLNYSDHDLRGISVPVLIIMGEKDEMIPWQEARELAAILPQAEFELIPDASHNEVIVPEGAFVNLVLDFFDRLAL